MEVTPLESTMVVTCTQVGSIALQMQRESIALNILYITWTFKLLIS